MNATHVGIANVGLTSPPQSLFAVPLDNKNNHAGLTFDIKNGIMLVSGTYKEDSRSRVFGFTISL